MNIEPTESSHERITRYRQEIEQASADLLEAEANLENERVDISAFERIVDTRLKPIVESLNVLEAQVLELTDELHRQQAWSLYGDGYPTIEEQLRAAEEKASAAPPITQPLSLQPIDKKEIKRLYRNLAKHYHPDLVSDNEEKVRRTEKMAVINDAYTSSSVVEILALSKSSNGKTSRLDNSESAQIVVLRALETELFQFRQRMHEIEDEKRNLHNSPMVQLSLQFKLAQLEGRNLLDEMAADLQNEIEMKKSELDQLKIQLGYPESRSTKTSSKKDKSTLTQRFLGRYPDTPINNRLRLSFKPE
jgi:hypothetical protein